MVVHLFTVKFEALGIKDLFRIISSLNYKVDDIKYINSIEWLLSVFLFNIRLGSVKETSQWDVSFTHPKHYMLAVIKKDHEYM